jgi:hypothetical protein
MNCGVVAQHQPGNTLRVGAGAADGVGHAAGERHQGISGQGHVSDHRQHVAGMVIQRVARGGCVALTPAAQADGDTAAWREPIHEPGVLLGQLRETRHDDDWQLVATVGVSVEVVEPHRVVHGHALDEGHLFSSVSARAGALCAGSTTSSRFAPPRSHSLISSPSRSRPY